MFSPNSSTLHKKHYEAAHKIDGESCPTVHIWENQTDLAVGNSEHQAGGSRNVPLSVMALLTKVFMETIGCSHIVRASSMLGKQKSRQK